MTAPDGTLQSGAQLQQRAARPPDGYKISRAIFSECGRYRYLLQRAWDPAAAAVMFIGLNPSTACQTHDDPSIRRCVRFAKDWGYGGVLVTNLFAFRSPHPRDLRQAADPIGPQNDRFIFACQEQVDLVVAAWGNEGVFLQRAQSVLAGLRRPFCLRLNKTGQPSHPLYLPADLTPGPMFPGPELVPGGREA